MRQEFIETIRSHFIELVKEIDPIKLSSLLVQNNVLEASEVDAILKVKNDLKHNNRLLLFSIERKEDGVYPQFLDGLRKIGLQDLATQLNVHPVRKRYGANVFQQPAIININHVDLNQDSVIEREEDLIPSYLDVKVVKSKSFQDDPDKHESGVYKCRSPNRGQVLIINNKEFIKQPLRGGSEVDVQSLKDVFEQMNCKVHIYEDLDVKNMQETIKEFASFRDDKISDVCIVIIMSHGMLSKERELVVIDKKNEHLRTPWIQEQFDNVHCKLFNNKPKIFLYQMCRGMQNDYAITQNKSTVETDSGEVPNIQRRVGDMLIGYATQDGYKANRDTKTGSWYIREICKVFMQEAHKLNVIEMLNIVDQKLKYQSTGAYTMQTSSYISNGFHKYLYFNPGIYEDDQGNLVNF